MTVPSELREVFRRNQKLLYGLLMQVSAGAVKDLCAEKRHLGALPGMLSVLGTWNGRLGYHPHVHLLITGGGITANGRRWEPARGEFFVPVAALSRTIAAQFTRPWRPRPREPVSRSSRPASGAGSGSPSASTTAMVTTPC